MGGPAPGYGGRHRGSHLASKMGRKRWWSRRESADPLSPGSAGPAPGGVLGLCERLGSVPLPPYIEAARKRRHARCRPGGAATADRLRYQTVFARAPGAVAAPTAGLHFTEALLAELERSGHELRPPHAARRARHLPPGDRGGSRASTRWTPSPTRSPRPPRRRSARAQREGRPVVAVGTTVVRTLEAVARTGAMRAGQRRDRPVPPAGRARSRSSPTSITNFHLPRSTLLMLVAAFAGRERVLEAYAEAIAAGYRFYSYGDAMLLLRGGALRVSAFEVQARATARPGPGPAADRPRPDRDAGLHAGGHPGHGQGAGRVATCGRWAPRCCSATPTTWRCARAPA